MVGSCNAGLRLGVEWRAAPAQCAPSGRPLRHSLCSPGHPLAQDELAARGLQDLTPPTLAGLLQVSAAMPSAGSAADPWIKAVLHNAHASDSGRHPAAGVASLLAAQECFPFQSGSWRPCPPGLQALGVIHSQAHAAAAAAGAAQPSGPTRAPAPREAHPHAVRGSLLAAVSK